MKALLINKFLYNKGGDAVCALATGELLRSRGWEVLFWGMRHHDNRVYPYQEYFVEDVDLNARGGVLKQWNIAGKLLYSFEAKSKIENLIKKAGKPDIVHLHNFAHQISPSILHVFKKYKIPCAMTMHDYKLICASYMMVSKGKTCDLCKGGRYFNCFLQGCVKNSKAKSLLSTVEMYLHHKLLHVYDLIDVFISPSMFLKEKVTEMGFKGKILHVPNFVNVSDFTPTYDWTERSICYLGRLSQEKGILTLVEAVKGLDVTLKIMGNGSLREQIKNKVKTEGISNVKLLGNMNAGELKIEISKSMFTVIPSEWYENNPRSVIESFALGTPVVGARIGGVPELVQDGVTGYTFKSGDVQDLEDKIRLMLNDEEKIKEFGKNGRVFVERELTADVHYDKLMAVYEYARRGVFLPRLNKC